MMAWGSSNQYIMHQHILHRQQPTGTKINRKKNKRKQPETQWKQTGMDPSFDHDTAHCVKNNTNPMNNVLGYKTAYKVCASLRGESNKDCYGQAGLADHNLEWKD